MGLVAFSLFQGISTVLRSWNPEFTVCPFQPQMAFRTPKALHLQQTMANLNARLAIKLGMVPSSHMYTPVSPPHHPLLSTPRHPMLHSNHSAFSKHAFHSHAPSHLVQSAFLTKEWLRKVCWTKMVQDGHSDHFWWAPRLLRSGGVLVEVVFF